MNTKPRIELMKKNQLCHYLSAEWLYIGSEDDGIRLKSPDKHLSDVIVPYSRCKYIKHGTYKSNKRR